MLSLKTFTAIKYCFSLVDGDIFFNENILRNFLGYFQAQNCPRGKAERGKVEWVHTTCEVFIQHFDSLINIFIQVKIMRDYKHKTFARAIFWSRNQEKAGPRAVSVNFRRMRSVPGTTVMMKRRLYVIFVCKFLFAKYNTLKA